MPNNYVGKALKPENNYASSLLLGVVTDYMMIEVLFSINSCRSTSGPFHSVLFFLSKLTLTKITLNKI